MPDFVPRADVKFNTFARRFCTVMAELAGEFNIAPSRIDELLAAQQDFAVRYQCAATFRSPAARYAKNEARKTLLRLIRAIAGAVKITASEEQCARLGIPPRRRRKAPLLPRPSTAPRVIVRRVEGRTLHLLVCDQNGKAKPHGVSAAAIFLVPGDTPPTGKADLGHPRHTTRRFIKLQLPTDLPPGTKVWLTARWSNPRHEVGPLCNPIELRAGYDLAPQIKRHDTASKIPLPRAA